MTAKVLNDRYELFEKIGEGGMAITYHARDRLLGRPVAVKVMREHLRADPEFVARFRREAQAAAQLSHEHIAGIYDTGVDGALHYIVMEYVPGEDLKTRLRRERPLEVGAAVELARQVAEALRAAQREGIVHRDIKPANILLTPEGRVKVIDFGLAKAMTATDQTDTGLILGSVHYFSPEQARGEAVGPQADVYSLGIVLYEMLTGAPPFEGQHPVAIAHQQIYDAPVPVDQRRPDLPPELAHVVMGCLEKDLSRRFASAGELLAYLESVAATLRQPRPAVGAPSSGRIDGARPAGFYSRRRATIWGLSALLLALLVAIGLSLWQRSRAAVPVSVPDIIGREAASARALLAQEGLIYREADRRYSDNIGVGAVMRQDPGAGGSALPGTVVNVVVSQGPEQVEVPNVTEMSAEQAARVLQEAGFAVGQTRSQPDDNIQAGYVMASRPPPHSRVSPDTPVDLVVSSGPKTPPPPPSDGEPGTHTAKVAFTVPTDAGPGAARVTVELTDARGTRIVYEDSLKAGEAIPEQTVGYVGSAVIRIYVDGKKQLERSLSSSTG
jgi:serine/threonine-protein kinase